MRAVAVEALYEAWKYTGRVAPGDTIVVADRKGGTLRRENSAVSSRGPGQRT